MHMGAAHPCPSLTRLMRPLSAHPSPTSAIIPLRSNPRPPRHRGPSASASAHADLCWIYTRRRRTVHPPGPMPGPRKAPTAAAAPPSPHVRLVLVMVPRFCARIGILNFCYLCTRRARFFAPRCARPPSRTHCAPVSHSWSSGYARVLAVRPQAGGSGGQGQADVIVHCTIIQ